MMNASFYVRKAMAVSASGIDESVKMNVRYLVVKTLLTRCYMLENRQPPSNEVLAFQVREIASLPCACRTFRMLFDETIDTIAESGAFSKVPSYYDLRRSLGYSRVQLDDRRNSAMKTAWLPAPSDRELMAIPFVASVSSAISSGTPLQYKGAILGISPEGVTSAKPLNITKDPK